MKAKRRQELKTNDLAQWLEDARVSFKDWGVYAVGGIAVAVIIAVIFMYRETAMAEGMERAFVELDQAAQLAPNGVPKTPTEILESVEEIDALAESTAAPAFRVVALTMQGAIAMSCAESAGSTPNEACLAAARKAFTRVVDDHHEAAIYYGRALMGLFQIEANEFAVDGDAGHKAKAAQYLERLRDDKRLGGTPYQTRAVDLLNELDEVFTTVEFAQRPAPSLPPVPAVTPAADAGSDKQPDAAGLRGDVASNGASHTAD